MGSTGTKNSHAHRCPLHCPSHSCEHLQINVQRRVAEFQKALVDIETQEHAALAAAGRDRQRKQQALAATAAERQAEQAQGRRQLMRSLRSEHEAKAAQAQQRVTELEITARQARERHQAAADAARKAAAAAAAQQEAQKEREAEEQAATQAAAAKQQQAQAQQEERAKASAAASLVPGILSISPGAAEFRQQCAQRLEAAQAAVRPFVEDRAMRDAKRSIDKFVTLNVQQISATLDQVRAKAQALASFVGQQQGVHRTYSLLTLAGKLLSQCEVQITRLHSFAFPLAEVAVAVGAAHGEFLDLLLARLHRACPLAVPCSYGYRPGTDEDEYLRLAGYKVTQEEGRVVKESTDEYVARMQGYVMLYAAITQSDNPANPHGLPHAWAYAARLLNALPATRVTAAALDAFLKVAGYKMAASYRGQFTKLLAAVDRHFLGELSASADPDARAVYTRLQTYLRTLAFNKAPEGRNMPRHDSSNYDRA